MAPVLGYWDIRGLAEPIRYLLSYLEIDFEDKRYKFGLEPDYYFETDWIKKDKHNLGLELPNIPYFVDGDVKITQSFAILRYLSRGRSQMYFPRGDANTKENIRFDMIEGHARDLYVNLAMLAYNPKFEEYREFFGSRVREQIGAMAKVLGSNDWLFGDKISYVDFVLFEALDTLKYCYEGCVADHPNLLKYLERFAALPGVQTYRQTSKKYPFYSPYASWGGKGEAPQQFSS